MIDQRADIYIESRFPNLIPANTSFPAWAFLNVTGGFNVAAAQADDSAPESTPIPTSTSTSSSVSSTTVASTTQSSSSTASSSSASAAGNPSEASHKTSHAGAIAGGVIGGLVFLAALAGLTVFVLRRRGSNSRSVSADTHYGALRQASPLPMSQNTFVQQQQPVYKPYDPSDPSTFPETIPEPTVRTTNSGYGLTSPELPGAYRGIPEV